MPSLKKRLPLMALRLPRMHPYAAPSPPAHSLSLLLILSRLMMGAAASSRHLHELGGRLSLSLSLGARRGRRMLRSDRARRRHTNERPLHGPHDLRERLWLGRRFICCCRVESTLFLLVENVNVSICMVQRFRLHFLHHTVLSW